MTATGSQAGIGLIILTVAVAVGIGFLVSVLFDLRRSAKSLTSVLTIAEQSSGPLLHDLNATAQELDRVTSDIGAAAVLLMAPKARQESAERIRELSHDLKERASATIDTAREKISSSVSRGGASSTRSAP